jgi:hypothetical protein
MPAVTIRAGATFEVPSREEIRADMNTLWDTRERVAARGLKPMRFIGVPAPSTQIGTALAFNIPYGPEPGYTWNVRLVAAQLSAAASLLAGIGFGEGDTKVPLVAEVNTASLTFPVTTFSSGQMFLNGGETLALWASSTVTLIAYGLFVIESPAERPGPLII